MEILKTLKEFRPFVTSKGQIQMMCPFRENHIDGKGSDSMFLSPSINAYHCFSCKAHGVLTKMLVKVCNVPIEVALKFITASFVPGEPERKVEFEIDESWIIEPSPVFSDRDIAISDATQVHFKIGTTSTGWTAVPYYFGGQLVGVQYRKGVKHGERSLKNSWQFRKANYLYNYDPHSEDAVVVEGYTDVMRLYDFEDHAEGLWGTDFSTTQAELLARHKKLYLAFDNDEAGRICTEKVAYIMTTGYESKIFVVPYVQKDPGMCPSRRLWQRYKKAATPYSVYAYEMTLANPDYPELKRKALRNIKK